MSVDKRHFEQTSPLDDSRSSEIFEK